jgi:hypothetical protein
VLESLDAGLLTDAHCWFGGGTRIAMELDEYRESQDIDFLCADIRGYRLLRSGASERSLGALLPRFPAGVTLQRDVRSDQYGIRTVFLVDGEPVKFEIILEARIPLAGTKLDAIAAPALDRSSCFAEKWLANADRWNDSSVLSRDAMDLAFMLMAWDRAEAIAGAELAMRAYGDAVRKAAAGAVAKLQSDRAYRRRCVEQLAIEDPKTLAGGLKKLSALAARLGKSGSDCDYR